MLKTIAVKNIVPNPYRHMEKYPIRENKIEELQRSYTETGVWPTIVGRMFGDKLELAFGHHRWVAAQRAGIKEIPVNVLKLSNEQMLKMMIHENSEDWGSNALIDQEALRATLEAIADGEVDLSGFVPKDTPKNRLLLAPSVLPPQGGEDVPEHARERCVYTKLAMAKFLGWVRGQKSNRPEPSERFEVAWRSLELLEAGITHDRDYEGLSRRQAMEVNKESHKAFQEWGEQQRRFEVAARNAEKVAASTDDPALKRNAEKQAAKMKAEAQQAAVKKVEEAKKVREHVANKLRSGAGVREAAKKAAEVKQQPKRQAPPPRVAELADRVAARIAKFLNDGDRLLQEVRAVIQYRGDCPQREIKRLASNLRKLATRCERLADQAEQPAEPTLTLIA